MAASRVHHLQPIRHTDVRGDLLALHAIIETFSEQASSAQMRALGVSVATEKAREGAID